jgi:hypothetical protein
VKNSKPTQALHSFQINPAIAFHPLKINLRTRLQADETTPVAALRRVTPTFSYRVPFDEARWHFRQSSLPSNRVEFSRQYSITRVSSATPQSSQHGFVGCGARAGMGLSIGTIV